MAASSRHPFAAEVASTLVNVNTDAGAIPQRFHNGTGMTQVGFQLTGADLQLKCPMPSGIQQSLSLGNIVIRVAAGERP